MIERTAPKAESEDFAASFDAGAVTLADGITGAHCHRVSQWFCGCPIFPLEVTTDRVLPDDIAALLCAVAEKLGLGDATSEPAGAPLF